MAVLRAGAGFGMILYAERGRVGKLQSGERAVEQRDMRGPRVRRQRLRIHREAVVHAGDLDPAVVRTLDRMVRAAMALVHLVGRGADGEAEELVAEADAEDGLADLQQLPDHRHGIFAGRGGIAGAVGEEHAIGLVGHHLVEGSRRRHHRDAGAGIDQVAQDVPLQPVIDRHDMRASGVGGMGRIALAQRPEAVIPLVALGGGNLPGEVHALQPRPPPCLGQQRGDIEFALRIVGDHAVGGALDADGAGERAGIDPGKPDAAVRLQPGIEILDRTEIGRRGHVLAHDQAERVGVGRLHILMIGADIADMGEGEIDDLPGEGRIGHDFLIAGHRGVEAHLAHGVALGTEPPAPDHGSIGQNQYASGTFWARVIGLGHLEALLLLGRRVNGGVPRRVVGQGQSIKILQRTLC
ncbi:putative thioesterase [Sphingomonas sp. MM-1]|nr:putative thioesterase [Sphingomonas sp. MM-1]